MKLAAVPTLPIPERIGEFTVIEPSGTGATGMVSRSGPGRAIVCQFAHASGH